MTKWRFGFVYYIMETERVCVMRSNVFMELGRVVFSNSETYTVDVITSSGRTLRGVPYLSPYSKPVSEGQGVYIVPEVDSYVMVFHLLPTGSDRFFGRDVFCLGFFNPADGEGFSSGREALSPGDFCLKTMAGNKIIGSTDGVILVYSTDLCQIQLFPFSGNVKDSAGLDNLIRAFTENFELHTDGGFLTWKVDKKENKTNFGYQFKNKPLGENNPDFIRGNLGSQGLMGDDEYFHTQEWYTTKAQGETEVLRVQQKEKIDGTLERTLLNADGEVKHHLECSSDGSKTEKQYNGGDLVWSFTRETDGKSKLTIGAGSEFNLEVSPEGKVNLYTKNDVQLSVEGTVQKTITEGYSKTITDGDVSTSVVSGQHSTTSQGDISQTSQTGKIALSAEAGEVSAKAPSVLLGLGDLEGVVTQKGADTFDDHTHTVTFELVAPAFGGAVTGVITLEKPEAKMPVSGTVKASD